MGRLLSQCCVDKNKAFADWRIKPCFISEKEIIFLYDNIFY